MSESPTDDTRTTDTGTDTGTTTTDTGPRTDAGSGQGEPEGQKWLSGFVSLIGLWIAISPFLYETTTDAALWNNVLVGAAIFLVAGYNYYRIVTSHTTSTGAMSLVTILGLWMIAAPFVIEYVTDGLFWSTIVSGALTAILAGYIAYAADETTTRTTAETAEGRAP